MKSENETIFSKSSLLSKNQRPKNKGKMEKKSPYDSKLETGEEVKNKTKQKTWQMRTQMKHKSENKGQSGHTCT